MVTTRGGDSCRHRGGVPPMLGACRSVGGCDYQSFLLGSSGCAGGGAFRAAVASGPDVVGVDTRILGRLKGRLGGLADPVSTGVVRLLGGA